MFGMPGGWEWIIILLIVVIVFGAGKLPKAARSMGEAINEFKDGIKPKDEDKNDDTYASSGDDAGTKEA